jgi:hypothetical protein
MCGTYAQKKWPDDIEAQCTYIIERNALMMSPLDRSELESTVLLSLRRKREYRYRCKSNQMSEFCNRKLCWTRRYGVEAPEYADKRDNPNAADQLLRELGVPAITNVDRFEYKDNPYYSFTVEPGVVFKATIEDITDPKLFQRLIIKAVKKNFPLTKKTLEAWILPGVNNANVIEIEDHLEGRVVLDKLLRDYVEARKNTDPDQPVETAIGVGNVKQLEDGRIVMVLTNFHKWLRRQHENFDTRFIQDQFRKEYKMENFADIPGAITIWLNN